MIKVLIVEDEVIIRRGILSLINWDSLRCKIIGEASNGVEACKFLENYSIDLVITDIKMPMMNGLDLAHFIYEKYPLISIIILSAFSEFEYAQQAIKYRVLNYVLKSNFVEELPKAVKHAVDEIICKKSIRNTESDNLISIEQIETIFADGILEGKINDKKSILRWFKHHNIELLNYFVLIAEINIWEQSEFQKLSPNIRDSMENFLTLALKNYNHLCVPMSSNIIAVLINMTEDNESKNLYSIVVVCNDILTTIKEYMSFDMNIGISNQHKSAQNVCLAYKEAVAALGNIYHPTSLALYQDIPKQKHAPEYLNLRNIAEDILNDLYSCNIKSLSEHIQNIFATFENICGNLEKLKIQALLLTSACLLNLYNKQIIIPYVDVDKTQQSLASEIMNASSPYFIKQILLKAFTHILHLNKCAAKQSNPFVVKVNQYIYKHYNSKIKLEELAQILHVNSSYLSRLYKKETGLSIISYLNSYRIDKAKELLKTGKYLISEVGYMVGIDDPAYFTNVFSKYTGMTPKNYYQSSKGTLSL